MTEREPFMEEKDLSNSTHSSPKSHSLRVTHKLFTYTLLVCLSICLSVLGSKYQYFTKKCSTVKSIFVD